MRQWCDSIRLTICYIGKKTYNFCLFLWYKYNHFCWFQATNTTSLIKVRKRWHDWLLWICISQLWHNPELGDNRQYTIWILVIKMPPLIIYYSWQQLCRKKKKKKKTDFGVKYIQVIEAFTIYYLWSYAHNVVISMFSYLIFYIYKKNKTVSPLYCNIIMYTIIWYSA